MKKGGNKYDSGKLRWDLVPIKALNEVVEIFNYGANKYGDRNWEKGIKWSKIYAAAMRHLTDFWDGDDYDEESFKKALAHVACNCLFLLEYYRTHPEMDDRPIRFRRTKMYRRTK